VDSCGFRRADSGSERGGIQRGQHCSWILVDARDLAGRDRWFWIVLSFIWKDWRKALVVVHTDTLVQVVEVFSEQDAKRYSIRDRDSIDGHEFRSRIQSLGMKEIVTAPGVLGRTRF
jgi:hypothetical protein